MKVLVLFAVFHFLTATGGHAICNLDSSLPLRHPGEVLSVDSVNSPGQVCPTEEEKTVAINRISEQVSGLIDSVLPQLQASLAPSPCQGLGWTKVVDMDMRNTSHECPVGWETESDRVPGKRFCKRFSVSGPSCGSAVFSTNGLKYSQVCGRIIAYQYGSTEAFEQHNLSPSSSTIDTPYMDGVVITHGNPREHIWSFASGYDEVRDNTWVCPCVSESRLQSNLVPAFVGENYFCESGATAYNILQRLVYSNDPLWDGQGCTSQNNCCQHHSPPYFSTSLSETTCDDLEVRICSNLNSNDEDIPVELVELYVK